MVQTGSYDVFYPETARQRAEELRAQAIHKCEFLRRKEQHFKYCGLQCSRDDAPLAEDSPIIRAMVTEKALQYCYDPNGNHCPRYQEDIRPRRANDEFHLEVECEANRVEYVPPSMALSDEAIIRSDSHWKILGRNYPVGRFEDHEVMRRMPYTVIYGRKLPIICAASIVVKRKTGGDTYIVIQEGKQGSGIIRLDKYKYDLPGGGLEPGESFEIAAKREFWKETGTVARITGLVGLVERISENQRVIWKAVYTGELTGESGGLMDADSYAVTEHALESLRTLLVKGMMKTPDVMLAINRAELGMVMDKHLLGTELSIIHMGWD